MALTDLSKILRYSCVGYMNGRGVAYCVDAEIFPHEATMPSVFAIYADNKVHPKVSVCDKDLGVIADEILDWMVVGPRILDKKPIKDAFIDIRRTLKRNAHLCVFIPSSEEEPIKKVLHSLGTWRLKETRHIEGRTLLILKFISKAKSGILVDPLPQGKRACIVRYGAIGDMIVITPLIKKLYEDGYKVTMNITSYAAGVLANNPYVDNIILQERNAIPNPDLGGYWDFWKQQYDKYINLSESIEGKLLKVEGRRDFFTSQSWRHSVCNKNYFDFTMELGGYPGVTGTVGELYFTPLEEAAAIDFREKHKNDFLILWALKGSSPHKLYGPFIPVITDWLNQNPDATLITVGGEDSIPFEFDHPQVIRAVNKWPLRFSMIMTKYADCVVGPETALTNAAGCFATPKITLLSHSTHENLCKYWAGDFCLAPDTSMSPCYPCHQLHYNTESCPIVQICEEGTDNVIASGPSCAMGAIRGEVLQARLDEVKSKTWRQLKLPY